MSLDVNGPEEAVMRSFPFDRHNITVLAIEGPSHGLQTLLSSQDYRLMCAVCRLDQLWVHWPSLQTDGASYAVEPPVQIAITTTQNAGPEAAQASYIVTSHRVRWLRRPLGPSTVHSARLAARLSTDRRFMRAFAQGLLQLARLEQDGDEVRPPHALIYQQWRHHNPEWKPTPPNSEWF